MTNIKNVIMGKVGRHLLKAQKHSPTILFAAGVVGVVGTVVLAVRATMKVEKVLDEHERSKADIELSLVDETTTFDQEDAKKALVVTYTRTSLSLLRLYAPTVLVGGISIAALAGSNIILGNRVSSLTAAYAVLDRGFRQYRERVVAKYGEQDDAEFRYGVQEREIVEETDEGPIVKTIKTAAPGASIYARWFDEGSTEWKRHPLSNRTFIRCQQDWANDMLNAYGYLFLNDVYKMLGLPKTSEGQLVGWVKNNPNGGDGYVDFGVFNNDEYTVERFIMGDEPTILLDFNVDGVVYDQIGKSRGE